MTANHGVLVSGLLCVAGALINGSTLVRVPVEEVGQWLTVYLVTTERHELLLANGLAAESRLPVGDASSTVAPMAVALAASLRQVPAALNGSCRASRRLEPTAA